MVYGLTGHEWLRLIYGQYLEKMGRSWENKAIVDGIRSVDLLQSFDFVDPERIGVIGHSGGAINSVRHMAYDERVRFGIVSGLPFINEDTLACIAPRPFLQLSGSLDEEGGLPEERHRRIENFHSLVRPLYEEHHTAEYLGLRIHPCGHHFLDAFKWEAYAKLKRYFGLEHPREVVAVADVLREARKENWSGINKAPDFPDINADGKMQVRISGKVATCSGLKVATDRSVATRGFKLKKSGHFESSFSHEKVDFRAAPARRSRVGMATWVGFESDQRPVSVIAHMSPFGDRPNGSSRRSA